MSKEYRLNSGTDDRSGVLRDEVRNTGWFLSVPSAASGYPPWVLGALLWGLICRERTWLMCVVLISLLTHDSMLGGMFYVLHCNVLVHLQGSVSTPVWSAPRSECGELSMWAPRAGCWREKGARAELWPAGRLPVPSHAPHAHAQAYKVLLPSSQRRWWL